MLLAWIASVGRSTNSIMLMLVPLAGRPDQGFMDVTSGIAFPALRPKRASKGTHPKKLFDVTGGLHHV